MMIYNIFVILPGDGLKKPPLVPGRYKRRVKYYSRFHSHLSLFMQFLLTDARSQTAPTGASSR